MGAMQNNEAAGNKKKKARGSVNNGRRLDALTKGKGSGQADWGEVDGELLQQVVVLITELGGAVTIGLSRDMGAHSLTLMLDGERETLWFNRDADLAQELRDVAGKLEALT